MTYSWCAWSCWPASGLPAAPAGSSMEVDCPRRCQVSVDGGAFDGVDGQFSMFPTDFPWTEEAGFVVEQPPVQLGDALTRARAKTGLPATDSDGLSPAGG